MLVKEKRKNVFIFIDSTTLGIPSDNQLKLSDKCFSITTCPGTSFISKYLSNPAVVMNGVNSVSVTKFCIAVLSFADKNM